MYLFFDTETTGLPKNWKASVTDLNNWPRLVQLAYLFYDKNGNIVFDTTGEKDAKIALIMEYYKDSVIFGRLKVRPALEKLKEQLTEKNINFNLGYNNYDEKAYYGEFVAR